MDPIKKYMAAQFIGKRLHFKCECLIPIDSVGIIKDFEISNNEIIFIVDVSGKLIKIGENHPNLKAEEI